MLIVKNTLISCQIRTYYRAVPAQTVYFWCDQKQKLEGGLRSCARSNLWLLSFNVPEYCLLQAYFNVETTALLILEPFLPMHFGAIGQRMVIILHTTAHNRIVPTNARTFAWSFSPGYEFLNQIPIFHCAILPRLHTTSLLFIQN